MNSVFNSQEETSLRLMLALSCVDGSLTIEEIVNADFVATYAKFYNVRPANLHGDSHFVNAEYPRRVRTVETTLKIMVATGLIVADHSRGTPMLSLTAINRKNLRSLKNDYATEYKKAFVRALKYIRTGKISLGMTGTDNELHRP